MRAIVAVTTLAGLASVLIATGAQASSHPTYCQKKVHAGHATVVKHTHGVTVYHHGQVYGACSDARRKVLDLLIADPGMRATKVAASSSRCVAILFTGHNSLPQILFKDLAGKEAGSSEFIVGYGNSAASVGSLAVSSNCAAAWGEAVANGSGGFTYRVQAKGFGAATSLTTAVTAVATVPAVDDVRHVGIRSAGRGVTVSWTLSGARQTRSLP